jgi:Ca2+-transporting ATPase
VGGGVRPGLTSAAAAERLAADGPNELPRPPAPSIARRVAGHLVEPLSAVLLWAAAL